MNERIRELAEQAGAKFPFGGFVNYDQFDYEKFAELVRADERDACAKLCDDKVDAEYATGKVDHNEMAWTQACATAIRARSEK